MVISIYAVDNEFAAATGSNVNAYSNVSRIDHPPSGSTDLVITAKPGDTEPRLFEVGDTYDINWGGTGGGGIIEDAAVVRSDSAPGSGGVIVFEGLNQNGNLTQIVWTPDFDLDAWYQSKYSHNTQPGFYTYDTNPDYSHGFVCFAAEARIATPDGPAPAGGIKPGDRILTLDHGAQTVRQVVQRRVPGQGAAAPVVFDEGSIGNTAPLRLSQQHRVFLKSPQAELWFGSAEVLVQAKAMTGRDAIRVEPCPMITYVHLLLDRHEVLSAEGAPCESLFQGPVAMSVLAAATPSKDVARSAKGIRHRRTARPVLSLSEARLLLRSTEQVKKNGQPRDQVGFVRSPGLQREGIAMHVDRQPAVRTMQNMVGQQCKPGFSAVAIPVPNAESKALPATV